MSLNIYNPTTQQLTEVAGLDVKDSLEKVATLPTPTADYLNQVYILVGTQEGYHVGSIYQCRYINSAYTWVEITGSVVDKADKAPNATNNHLAKLTADGNLADSGIAVGDLGTAINKNWTDLVRPNSHDLVESNAVYSAITNAISSIYTPHGDITCAELVPALLIEENIGNVYTVTDSGTTTAYFMQGVGKTINTGDSVSIIKAGENTILFNLMGNVLDLTGYQKKNLATPLVIGGTTQTTVESALNGLNDHEEEDIEGIYKANGVLGAKNLIPFDLARIKSLNTAGTWTNNVYTPSADTNVTFTVNNDGTVEITGNNTANVSLKLVADVKTFTQNQNYIISGCPSDGSINTYYLQFTVNDGTTTHYYEDVGNEKEFTYYSPSDWNGINIGLKANAGADGKVFKPMLRLASDTDSTYVPYTKSNRELTQDKAEQAEVKGNWSEGGKNLIPFPYTDGFSKTMNGITFVVNSDGSITINGTATTTAHFMLQKVLVLEDGAYILTGDMDEEISYNKTAILFNENDASGTSYWNYGKDAPCEFTQNGWKVSELRIRITSGVTVNNQTFYPMIRLASDPDDTYVPYAKTNQQLTKDDNGLIANAFVNGAVNLLPNTATSQVFHGVTYTVNSDGTIQTSGTASDSGGQFIISRFYLPNGFYKLSGGINSNRPLVLAHAKGDVDAVDYGNGVIFEADSSLQLALYIGTTGNMSGLTYKPMITVAEMPNSDYDHYTPYAMTNKQITDVIPSDASASNKLVAKSDIKSVRVPIANVVVGGGTAPYYYTTINTGLPSTAIPIGFKDGGNWDERVKFVFNAANGLNVTYYGTSAYTIPSTRQPITVYYIE